MKIQQTGSVNQTPKVSFEAIKIGANEVARYKLAKKAIPEGLYDLAGYLEKNLGYKDSILTDYMDKKLNGSRLILLPDERREFLELFNKIKKLNEGKSGHILYKNADTTGINSFIFKMVDEATTVKTKTLEGLSQFITDIRSSSMPKKERNELIESKVIEQLRVSA